jgi:RNA polymerase sigma-70 factor (ECF subfamily)
MVTNRKLAGRINSLKQSENADDERRLMERVSAGDEESLVAIYDRYSSLAYALALHVLRDPSAAEDITQEIFMRLWREPKAYDPARGSLSAWITINARHRSVDYWRKHRRESQISDNPQIVEPSARPPEYLPDFEKVRAILGTLPASQRELLELSYFGGFSHSEIVLRTGLPLGTVKTRIRQALRYIRRTLSPNAVE